MRVFEIRWIWTAQVTSAVHFSSCIFCKFFKCPRNLVHILHKILRETHFHKDFILAKCSRARVQNRGRGFQCLKWVLIVVLWTQVFRDLGMEGPNPSVTLYIFWAGHWTLTSALNPSEHIQPEHNLGECMVMFVILPQHDSFPPNMARPLSSRTLALSREVSKPVQVDTPFYLYCSNIQYLSLAFRTATRQS